MERSEALEALWKLSDTFAQLANAAESVVDYRAKEFRSLVSSMGQAGRAAAYRSCVDLLRAELRIIEGVDV